MASIAGPKGNGVIDKLNTRYLANPLRSLRSSKCAGRVRVLDQLQTHQLTNYPGARSSTPVTTLAPWHASDFLPCLVSTATLSLPAHSLPPRSRMFYARGLARTYGDGEASVAALAGVDFDLFSGELVVLLGPSGSGKSTLLNQLGGLDSPTHGSLLYRDWDLGAADEPGLTQFRRNAVGFVFQAYNLIPSLTARENVALIAEIARNPMAPEEALTMVGLADRMDHFPAQLSGGEQQRVAIARAIAKRPEVLLCDEPTGALDVRTGITVLEAIERINRELGTLAVIITHNAIIAGMADRVFTLSDGRLVHVQENPRRGSVRDLAW